MAASTPGRSLWRALRVWTMFSTTKEVQPKIRSGGRVREVGGEETRRAAILMHLSRRRVQATVIRYQALQQAERMPRYGAVNRPLATRRIA